MKIGIFLKWSRNRWKRQHCKYQHNGIYFQDYACKHVEVIWILALDFVKKSEVYK